MSSYWAQIWQEHPGLMYISPHRRRDGMEFGNMEKWAVKWFYDYMILVTDSIKLRCKCVCKYARNDIMTCYGIMEMISMNDDVII